MFVFGCFYYHIFKYNLRRSGWLRSTGHDMKNRSRTTGALLAILIASALASALDVPTLVSFSGRFFNETGSFYPVSVQINISNTSQVIWSHSFDNVSDSAGVFNLVLGRTYQLNITPGVDYDLVLEADVGSETFVAGDLTFGDNNPAGDQIKINGGGPSDATELLLSDGATTVEDEFGNYLPLSGGTLTGALQGTTATFSGSGSFDSVSVSGGFSSGGISLQSGGDLWVSGDLYLLGNLTSTTVNQLNVNGSLIPAADGAFDLGNTSNRWNRIFLANTIGTGGNGPVRISSDGLYDEGILNLSGDLYFYGELAPDGASCSDGEMLQRSGGSWTCTTAGDVTGVLAGYGVEVTASAGPQPRVNLSSTAAGAGLTYSSGVLSVNAGPGLDVVADTLGLRLYEAAADAASATTQSPSGMEVVDGNLSLILGCAGNQILKWNETGDQWYCAADETGAGAAATPYWITQGAYTTSNSSINSGNINVSGELNAQLNIQVLQAVTVGDSSLPSTGSLNISDSLYFHGELAPEGTVCSNGDLLIRLGAGQWGCINNESVGAGSAGDSVKWISQGGYITSNASIDSGNVNISADLHVTNTLSVAAAAPPSTGDVNISGDIYVGGSMYGSMGDVAEKFHTPSGTVEPGEVVIVDAGHNESITISTQPYDCRVAGVVSTDPAHVLAEWKDGAPLALTGNVPVKVTNESGSIMPGDLLTTSSTPGHAMKYELKKPTGEETIPQLIQLQMTNLERTCSVIGRALEPMDSSNGTVKALLT